MIRYSLVCAKGHQFESWFQSAAAWDRLQKAGQLSCAVCGSGEVTKALMAPSVRSSDHTAMPPAPDQRPGLTAPANPAEEALAELRRKIEAESDYVGLAFAAEARAMHEGERPHRPIYGEARPDEARALLQDGVPIAPLPFLPRRQAN
jgi:hypothetical protein